MERILTLWMVSGYRLDRITALISLEHRYMDNLTIQCLTAISMRDFGCMIPQIRLCQKKSHISFRLTRMDRHLTMKMVH